MPKAKTIRGETRMYKDVSIESDLMGETNDCVVKMVAMAASITYQEAHRVCADHGRKIGCGMYKKHWIPMLQKYVKLEPVDPQYFICRYPGAYVKCPNVTTHHPERFPGPWADGHNYILVTSTHVSYVENGHLHDWAVGRALRVKSIWRVIK